MSVAILGPTFQDLAANVNRNISGLSLIFVGRATGFLCGSMIGGVLFDHMNQFFLLGVSMVATAVALYLIPFCKTAVLLMVTMSVFGASVGVVDTGANVLILAIWGDKGAPHMQALHFSFALGAVLAPLLAKLAWSTSESTQNHTESDFDPLMLNRSSEASPDSLFAVPENMNLLWAYTSTGTYILVVSVFLFGLFCIKHSRQKKNTDSAQGARRAKYHRTLLCLLFVFFFFYVGAEITFGSYLFSFATTHVGMKESEAAGLNSVFWGTFAACRGLAIFFATFLQPGTMIVLSNIGSLVSSFFLVLFDKSPLCLWIATAVYGASMATTFPSGVSWIEQYTTLTGKSAAFFVIGASLGDMAIPAVIGILQGNYPDLPVVLYVCFASAIFTGVIFPVMYKLATLPLERQRKGKRKGEDQKALSTSSRL
ncbi:sodium-dependent glucose transporter 1A-like isoform X2 [Chionomys nivalis]|uniref:sodium-dependent glucose transporter 1A-like isoform X2 n=2 Tax=Chionomys nivalis TaxID=269649 RepID=UPI002592CD46|nr:sodium-dependent glucose transporter 1A-like isoform X2 [Chionomys nivalis]